MEESLYLIARTSEVTTAPRIIFFAPKLWKETPNCKAIALRKVILHDSPNEADHKTWLHPLLLPVSF